MANQIVPARRSAVTATLIIGRVQPLESAVDVYERPGIDGHGLRVIGARSPVSAVRFLKNHSSYSAARLTELAVRALVGVLCEIEYDVTGQSETNVVILSVSPTIGSEAIRASVDQSGNTHVVDLTLTCQKVV